MANRAACSGLVFEEEVDERFHRHFIARAPQSVAASTEVLTRMTHGAFSFSPNRCRGCGDTGRQLPAELVPGPSAFAPSFTPGDLP